MKQLAVLVCTLVSIALSSPSHALSQLYDKDKKELASNLYGMCVANNKKLQTSSNTKDGFIETHCKCFATNTATKLSTNKSFVDAYNSKNSEAFGRILNEVAPSINTACYNAALEQHGGVAFNEEQLSKISDKVGLGDAEKGSFIKSFVYACVNEGIAEAKSDKQTATNYCSCIAEITSTKISSRDVAQFGMNRNTKRVDAAMQSAAATCAPKLK